MSIPEWPGESHRVSTVKNERSNSDLTTHNHDEGSFVTAEGNENSLVSMGKGSTTSSRTMVLKNSDGIGGQPQGGRSNDEEDTSPSSRERSSSSTFAFTRDSVDTVTRRPDELTHGDVSHGTPIKKTRSERSSKVELRTVSPQHSKSSLANSFKESPSHKPEIAPLKMSHDGAANSSGIQYTQNAISDSVAGLSGSSTRSIEQQIQSLAPKTSARELYIAPSFQEHANIIPTVEQFHDTGVLPDIKECDNHAKGDFSREQKPKLRVEPETIEISEFRKNLYKGFPAKGEHVSEKRRSKLILEKPELVSENKRIQQPATRKQRSPLLSIVSTISYHGAEKYSPERLTNEQVDCIFPRGAKELLAKLQNPLDLEGLRACLEEFGRQDRLLSAMRLLESQAPPTPYRDKSTARLMKIPVRHKQTTPHPSCRLPPNRPPDLSRAKLILQQVLECGLRGAVYSFRWAADVCRVIAAFITQETKALRLPRYKTSCLVRIVEKRHQRLCTNLAVLWDSGSDTFCEAHYEQNTFFAHALLFVVYLD